MAELPKERHIKKHRKKSTNTHKKIYCGQLNAEITPEAFVAGVYAILNLLHNVPRFWFLNNNG